MQHFQQNKKNLQYNAWNTLGNMRNVMMLEK